MGVLAPVARFRSLRAEPDGRPRSPMSRVRITPPEGSSSWWAPPMATSWWCGCSKTAASICRFGSGGTLIISLGPEPGAASRSPCRLCRDRRLPGGPVRDPAHRRRWQRDDQLAILLARPPHLWSGLHLMSDELPFQAPRKALVKQDAHGRGAHAWPAPRPLRPAPW